MNPTFHFPNIDHLVEGVHYTVVDWNFAEGCANDERMIFGMCRKVGGGSGEKDFDSSKKTKQEEGAEAEAKKQGSDVKSNKPVTVNGKKMGWAIKNGKPVMVEWGSVAGEKKVGPKQSKQARAAQAAQAPSRRSQLLSELNTKANDPGVSEDERTKTRLIIDELNRRGR